MRKLTILVLTVAFAAVSALGQAPTLRIVQPDGPDLPAELFYGNIKVKPLRLRPGTTTPITINDADFFASQQYLDFLARFPDQTGFDYWTNQITACINTPGCNVLGRKVGVSAAFFVEAEFQRTGSFVYRLYKGGLARRPSLQEFKTDRALVREGATLEADKQAAALNLVQRAEFVQKYALQTTADSFVDALILSIRDDPTSNIDLSTLRTALIAKYNTGANLNQSRAFALRDAIDSTAFVDGEYNAAFVLMQYFGYLRRDPDQGGYDFWLGIVNNPSLASYRSMVCAFVTSQEYQERFGNTLFYTDRECANIN